MHDDETSVLPVSGLGAPPPPKRQSVLAMQDGEEAQSRRNFRSEAFTASLLERTSQQGSRSVFLLKHPPTHNTTHPSLHTLLLEETLHLIGPQRELFLFREPR